MVMIQDFSKLAFKINAVSMYAYTRMNEHLWYPWKASVVPQRAFIGTAVSVPCNGVTCSSF
jgi:hypothetical protein